MTSPRSLSSCDEVIWIVFSSLWPVVREEGSTGSAGKLAVGSFLAEIMICSSI